MFLLGLTFSIFHEASSSDGTTEKRTSSCAWFVDGHSSETGFPFFDWLWSCDKRFQKKKIQYVRFTSAVCQSLMEGWMGKVTTRRCPEKCLFILKITSSLVWFPVPPEKLAGLASSFFQGLLQSLFKLLVLPLHLLDFVLLFFVQYH